MARKNPFEKCLREASSDAVSEGVRKLRPHISSGYWIGLNNIYAKTYTQKPYRNILTRRSSLKNGQMRDYVAASVFNHCSDGWSLLGRALSLHIKGDGNSAVHLAYYAELRAAMSLLASEGIGVFNNRHIIISDTGVDLTPDLSKIKGLPSEYRGLDKTHRFVWMALEHWANRKLSAEKLAEIITPGSIKLIDWLTVFEVDTQLGSIGSDWLKTWGIDIKQFGDDQVLRNHSSYRPSRILPKQVVTAPDSLDFLRELWHMCEPNPSSRFSEIDRHLLRLSLSQAYKAAKGVDPRLSRNIKNYRVWVEGHIKEFGFGVLIRKEWVDFLTWATHPQDLKIIESVKLKSIKDPSHHLGVLARAFLLLRFATGINGNLLREAGFTKKDLEFWWQPYAVDHGLIDDGSGIADFVDLWDEINVSLQDIDLWSDSNIPPYSYNKLMEHVAQKIFRLSECERIALWGLGI